MNKIVEGLMVVISQKRLKHFKVAEALGIDHTTFSKIVNGKIEPSRQLKKAMELICSQYTQSHEDLIRGVENEKKSEPSPRMERDIQEKLRRAEIIERHLNAMYSELNSSNAPRTLKAELTDDGTALSGPER